MSIRGLASSNETIGNIRFDERAVKRVVRGTKCQVVDRYISRSK